MSKPLTLVCSCRMGPGTLEAKLIPLGRVEKVDRIIVLRKTAGPPIPKVEYRILPKLCRHPLLNIMITPILMARIGFRQKADYFLAYHYKPHFFFAGFASLLTGIPYILGQTGQDIQKAANKKMMGPILIAVLRRAAVLNVPGNKSLSFWKEKGVKKVQQLHSTVDTDYYHPSDQAKEFDFIYTGRMEDYKGVDLILQAFAKVQRKHPETKLAIVGYGSREAALKKLALELGLASNVVFAGFQSDVRSWLQRSRVFVMASYTEGLPCALMEAMSCAMICISSYAGNIPDILRSGETGFGFECGKLEALSNHMEFVLSSNEGLDAIAKAARAQIVQKHSHASAVEKWNSLFKDMEAKRS
ncbi:MAG: glycosyltransferase [Candidatus Cloacimonadaceae bacterium]|nr:glycosyltransferase [Candidatus Cloacimonadota bacterium]MDX9948979.1 glycosyltransferase [Candidatus Syntrophosphaera sp.]